jgi:two-component system cell cycle response regulator
MLDAGFDVIEAADGAEGLRAFSAEPPDVILLDAMMPIMDGITMCRHLRALPGGAGIPILMITARSDHTSITAAFAAGVTDFIQKPVNLLVLEHRIQRMVDASRTEAALYAANASLERRVQDRTVALHQVNEQLVIELVERARFEAALRDSEVRFRVLFENSPDALWLLDPVVAPEPWIIVDCNEAAARMHGYQRDELIGQTMACLDPQPDRPRIPTPAQQIAWGTGRISGEDRHRCKDGTLIAIEFAMMPVRLNGRDLVLGVDREISARKQAEHEHEHLIQQPAMTDALTDLYNRRGFFKLGEREVERARRTKRPLTLIMIDVDNFKQVNDGHGHAVGDLVLRAIGERCARNVRVVDVIGRYGGEEFAVLLPDTDIGPAQIVAERLRHAIAAMVIPTRDAEVAITVSAGIASLHDSVSDLVSLLQAADAALYAAKRAGRNCVVVQEGR